jgi:S-adenosylmethionine:tRNA ribosyltransferase-isomerase
MIAADLVEQRSPKLLIGGGDGVIRHLPRAALASLFSPGDLVVANDAATLPASLKGIHYPSGRPIEVRLAAWISAGDLTQFIAMRSAPVIFVHAQKSNAAAASFAG